MAKKFSERVARMSPESRARSDARYRQLLAEMPLQELRRALDLTQRPVAAALGINPVAVSTMESQTDRYVSTLRRCVEAMGGELRSVAHCPQGAVEISPFQREAEPTEPAAG
ncbi:MAG: transcriptional regulator [Candidatus Contendobacter sp.]|nr:MAG: transcriptional regulator [Candidatus Contendobacter sp.]